MAADVFCMDVGPYIPGDHMPYDLLPRLRGTGGEVFAFPAELDVVERMLAEVEDGDAAEGEVAYRLAPISKQSYAAYFSTLSYYALKYRNTNPELADAIEWLDDAVRRMNVKEEWSVVRYVGHEYDDDVLGHGLTRGRCYYWPSFSGNPMYAGVIDDDETTPYLYPCDPGSWEIVADPTGMAARALAGDAETIEGWYPDLAKEEGSIYAEFAAMGVMPKQSRQVTACVEEKDDDGWRGSESDPFDITCPECDLKFEHRAWTLVNARNDPDLAQSLMDGKLFEFECPRCGYQASLANPCLYLDPKARACVYLVANEGMARGVEDMFDELAASDGPTGGPGIIRRIVFDRHDLRGRAIALCVGLDDRTVEILKVALVGSAKRQGAVPMDDDSSVVNLIGVEDGDLIFQLECGDTFLTAAMPRGAYDLYEGAIMRSSLAGEQPYYVDRSWTHHAIDVLDAEGVL